MMARKMDPASQSQRVGLYRQERLDHSWEEEGRLEHAGT